MHVRGVVALALLLALPALSGCLSAFQGDKDPPAVRPADVGYDPSLIRVTSVVKHAAQVPSADGVLLDVVAYEPRTSDKTPAGEAPRWGTVLFLHGWGILKEEFEGVGGASGAPVPANEQLPYSQNRLEAFAQAGLVAVAYDARGFGRSEGQATVAGPLEALDLEAVRAWAEATFPSNGLFGVVGVSYGAGQAYQAIADNPRIATAVPMYGWVDLYDGLAPGNVPKAEWLALLGTLGIASSGTDVDPILVSWAQKLPTRTDLGTVEAEMDARSATGRLAASTKPVFACQGLQESLFPQVDRAWGELGGFVRALVYTGGHGTDSPECWARALDWSRYFLGGFDGDVAEWPALSTVDANGARVVDYAEFPVSVPARYFLDEPNLESGFPSQSTFTVSQNLLNNPLQEPSAAWDLTGQGMNPVPERLREDPTAVPFETAPFTSAEVILGAPTLRLDLADPAAATTPFQVTAQLLHVNAGGQSRILTRAAFAALGADDIAEGAVTLQFHWVKADVAPGDKLVLKVGGNDSSWYLPLPSNYSVDFRGTSELTVPLYEG